MSVGSVSSFFQQDQSYWQQAQAQSQASTADNSLIEVMGQAETNLAKGLASIANGTALKRVNSELSAAVQAALNPSSSTSSSSSGSTSSSSSSSPNSSTPSPIPAVGTGTAPLTTGTALLTLGIPAGGSLFVATGIDTTTYSSTGTDTIGDLINAINVDIVGNANVTASLNNKGELVITSRNDTDTITVGGTYASNIGFAAGHDTFEPTQPASSSAKASGSSSTSKSSTSSAASGASNSTASSSTAKKSKVPPTYTELAQQNANSAASILSAAGAGGTLVDMLA